MLAVILLVAPPPVIDAYYPGVCLDDARAFGVDAGSCRGLWLAARDHAAIMRDEVRSWNAPDVCNAWAQECQWRQRCWYLLDDALFCESLTVRQKLRSLNELRGLIGDADYYAGRMPDPIPSYRR